MNAKKSEEKAALQEDGLSSDVESGVDGQPDVQAAADRVEQAREQLRSAEACYHNLREQAAAKVEQVRQKNVGDLIDLVVGTAKKYPTASLFTAGLLGYLLGRLFRR